MKTRVVTSLAALSLALGLTSFAASPGGADPIQTPNATTAPQHGIDSLVLDSCQSASLWQADATAQVKAVKALDANAIGITFPFYTDSATSNNFYGKLSCTPGQNFHTPSTARVAVLISAAHTAGLKVLLRPFLDQTNLIKQNIFDWRGNIKPANPKVWFTNYTNALLPYLKLAQQLHVEHFAISSELESMASFSNWTGVIKSARAAYKGNLVFTFSWVKNKAEVRPLNTTPGMDTYPGFKTLTNTSTQAQALAAWNHLLSTTDKLPWISSVVDDEVGISAQDNAYADPSSNLLPIASNPFNQTIQVNWFGAACSFVKQHQMKGVYFWGLVLTNNFGKLATTPDTASTGDLQPLSQRAIKTCFSTK